MVIKCLLKKPNENKINFILDLESHILYSESEIFNESVYDKVTKETIGQLKSDWER